MVDKEKLLNNSINIWGSYDPGVIQYARFYEKDPSQLATGRKVVDTYHAYTTGRASLYFSYEESFGDLAKDDDEFSKLFVRSMFVRNSIMQFGLSLDMSWQTVWAFIYPSRFEDIIKDNYTEFEKNCYRENLIEQLDCCIAQGNLKAQKLEDIVKRFDNDETTLKLRTLYNYMKHRGDIYIEGLGVNNITQGIQVNGVNLPALSRPQYKMEELQQLAYDYALKFTSYFQSIVDIVIPEEYKDNKSSFEELINAQLEMKEIIDKLSVEK